MLDSLKSTLRLLKNRWMKVNFKTRFFVFALLIGLILGCHDIVTSYTPMQAEENYSAMETLVTSMVETKSTDVDFDTSKIYNYEVIHNKNGEYKITIAGARLEKMYATLTEDYQIKTLERNGIFILFIFWITYVGLFIAVGYLITAVLYVNYRIIRKIVLFLEE